MRIIDRFFLDCVEERVINKEKGWEYYDTLDYRIDSEYFLRYWISGLIIKNHNLWLNRTHKDGSVECIHRYVCKDKNKNYTISLLQELYHKLKQETKLDIMRKIFKGL